MTVTDTPAGAAAPSPSPSPSPDVTPGGDAESCPLLQLDPNDNVATALTPLPAGLSVRVPAAHRDAGPDVTLTLASALSFGHKVALAPIPAGGEIRKYGEVIGRATTHIAAGAHVHVHNVESRRARGDLAALGR